MDTPPPVPSALPRTTVAVLAALGICTLFFVAMFVLFVHHLTSTPPAIPILTLATSSGLASPAASSIAHTPVLHATATVKATATSAIQNPPPSATPKLPTPVPTATTYHAPA